MKPKYLLREIRKSSSLGASAELILHLLQKMFHELLCIIGSGNWQKSACQPRMISCMRYPTLYICPPAFCRIVELLATLDFVDFLVGTSDNSMEDGTRKELRTELEMSLLGLGGK